MRRLAHWEHGRYDPLAASRHRSTAPSDVLRAARVQACLYTTLDAWAKLAREENIRWSPVGGSLLGAWCYNSMPVWDDDMDISVPEQDCKKLDRIWQKASISWDKDNRSQARSVTRWQPRYFRRLRLTVWKALHGRAASNGHRKFTAWGSAGPRREPVLHGEGGNGQSSFLLGVDVMCTNHQVELTRPGGKMVLAMKNFTDALIHGRLAPVEFGPTTIPLVTPSVALEYTRARGWDTSCGRMPPMSKKAIAALSSYSATGPACDHGLKNEKKIPACQDNGECFCCPTQENRSKCEEGSCGECHKVKKKSSFPADLRAARVAAATAELEREEGREEEKGKANTQQQYRRQPAATAAAAVPPLPTMGAMLSQLQVELELGGDASLAQAERSAAAFGYVPDPSLTRRQRTVALWKEIVSQ